MEKLTKEEVGVLQPGTILQNTGSGDAYVVVFSDGRTTTAVKSLTVTNPQEWMVVSRPEKVR